MADSSVAVTPGSGASVDTRTESTNGNHRQVVVLGDPSTNAGVAPVDSTNGLAVDVKQSALPSGAATSANQSTANTALAAIQTAIEILDNIVSGNEAQVDIVAALPAGTNNIGDVDVLTVPADPFGANADAAATAGSTGSMQAKLRLMTSQLDSIKTAVETLDNAISGSEIQADIVAALPAGNNNIGDVDVASIAAGDNNIGNVDIVTQPARAATTDTITAKLATDAIQNGTTALTPKFAIIDAATSGNNTIIAAVASKKIRVLSVFLMASAAVNARFESGTDGTALTGQMNLATNGGFVLPFNPVGWFETGSNTLLNLELSGAVSVDGSITYVEV